MSKFRSRVGGRRPELLNLSWASIDLDDATVRFKRRKGRRDRIVPVNPDVVDVLRKVRAQTMQEPGPFTGL
ncbi:MAG: tyrosine-type recombinase/integrase [Phycisphaerales bacterium]|nr:MAG: tyrosine-type recombinase/integrase [Phycisphaerales bacterium]